MNIKINRINELQFMKLLIISVLGTLIINNVFTIDTAYASDYNEKFQYIESRLEELQVPEDYSKRIIEHIENVKLSESEVEDIISKTLKVITNANEMQENGFDIKELLEIYDDSSKLLESVDVEMKLNIITQEVKFVSKDTNEVIFKCNKDDVSKYYTNFQNMNLSSSDYYNIMSDVKDNIIVAEKSNIHSETNYNKVSEDVSERSQKELVNDSTSNNIEGESNYDKHKEFQDKVTGSLESNKEAGNKKLILAWLIFIVLLVITVLVNKNK